MRFQNIDDTNREIHTFLAPEDRCLFLREYTSGKDYSFSETNSLISNLKKKKGAAGFAYKARAISQCAAEMADGLNPEWLKTATLVPVPPSKIDSDPNYDDRIEQICKGIAALKRINVDIRSLVRQTQSMQPAHEGRQRPTVQDLLDVYEIDELIAAPAPTAIGIVDDVLTVGTHFKAMSTILKARFPAASIVGIFVARRVLPTADDTFDDLFA